MLIEFTDLNFNWRELINSIKSVQIGSFFWSVFSRIRTEYGDLRTRSPYSVRMRENTDQKLSRYLDTFHAVSIIFITLQTFSLNYLYQTQEMSMKEFSFIKF